MFGIGGSTTKKRLIVSPYEVEDRPSLIFPNSPYVQIQQQITPSPEIPGEVEYLSYDMLDDPFNL